MVFWIKVANHCWTLGQKNCSCWYWIHQGGKYILYTYVPSMFKTLLCQPAWFQMYIWCVCHMKVHMVSYNLDQKKFQNPKFIFCLIMKRRTLKWLKWVDRKVVRLNNNSKINGQPKDTKSPSNNLERLSDKSKRKEFRVAKG